MTSRSTDQAEATAAARRALVRRLFPDGIPALWCPTLTHFSAPGRPDGDRIGRHLRWIAPYVRGILVPGSTGEGWEMSDAQVRDVLSVALDAAQAAGIQVLVGVLKTEVGAVLECIDSTVAWLKARTGADAAEDALARSHVVGFTVCPPKGSQLSQSAIGASLGRVLDLDLPIALYQLPQVTGNTMLPETVEALAARYANFYLFKDTSGQDQVALAGLWPVSDRATPRTEGLPDPGRPPVGCCGGVRRPAPNLGRDLGGVFLVRGAEGDYTAWPKTAGGPYDGFLLSTANVFARQFHEILGLLDAGDREAAIELAQRVERVVKPCFALVADFPAGNPFTNANKLLDHVMAYGPAAATVELPLLFGGARLPAGWVATASRLLAENRLLPEDGYCACRKS
jgi:dihydrodipicolinate synthase/N-acetylneuraminate lyase